MLRGGKKNSNREANQTVKIDWGLNRNTHTMREMQTIYKEEDDTYSWTESQLKDKGSKTQYSNNENSEALGKTQLKNN